MVSARLISAPGQGSTWPPDSLPLPAPIPPKGVPSFRLGTTLWPLGTWWLWWCGCSVVSYSLKPHGFVVRQAPLSPHPWDSPGKNTGMGWVAISSSRRSFPPRDQGCSSCLSCTDKQILYHLGHLGSPGYLGMQLKGQACRGYLHLFKL